LNHVSQFRTFSFVAAAIRRFDETRLSVNVITNQSGVGRGYFPESLVHTVHELMTQQLAAAGVTWTLISPTAPALGGYWFAPATGKANLPGMRRSGPGRRTLSQKISPERPDGF
jgi:histidinol phosphatase-like enzyme